MQRHRRGATGNEYALLVGMIAILAIAAALALVLGYSIWKYVGWQNESRNLMGMEPLSPLVWPTILIVGALTFWLLLAAGRAFRTLFRWGGNKIDKWLPRRLAVTLNAAVMLLIIWGLLSGAIIAGRLGIRSANSTNSVVTNTNDSANAILSRPGPS